MNSANLFAQNITKWDWAKGYDNNYLNPDPYNDPGWSQINETIYSGWKQFKEQQ